MPSLKHRTTRRSIVTAPSSAIAAETVSIVGAAPQVAAPTTAGASTVLGSEQSSSGLPPSGQFEDNCQPATGNSPAPADNSVKIKVPRDQLLINLRESIDGHAKTMINAIIQQGEKGSYLHAKFLFEFAGLSASPAAEADASPEESLAKTLLRALAAGAGPQL